MSQLLVCTPGQDGFSMGDRDILSPASPSSPAAGFGGCGLSYALSRRSSLNLSSLSSLPSTSSEDHPIPPFQWHGLPLVSSPSPSRSVSPALHVKNQTRVIGHGVNIRSPFESPLIEEDLDPYIQEPTRVSSSDFEALAQRSKDTKSTIIGRIMEQGQTDSPASTRTTPSSTSSRPNELVQIHPSSVPPLYLLGRTPPLRRLSSPPSFRPTFPRNPRHPQRVLKLDRISSYRSHEPGRSSRGRSRASSITLLPADADTSRRQDLNTGAVADRETINHIVKQLKRSCYDELPVEEYGVGDSKALIECILYLLDNKLLPDEGDIYCRARHVVTRHATTKISIPASLLLEPSDVVVTDEVSVEFGGYADVYRGKYRGILVAYKRIRVSAVNQDVCREALAWRMLSHPSILPFIGVYLEPSKSFISLVSPWMPNGSLSEWRKKSSPPTAEIQEKILSVAEGLAYIHAQGFAHGDICGRNIFLDHDFRIKIADFGAARHLNSVSIIDPPKSYQFAAPELFGDESDDNDEGECTAIQRTTEMDVYAFACLYREIHFNRLPFRPSMRYAVMMKVRRGGRPTRPPHPPLDDKAWALIERCWHQKPNERLTMGEVVRTMNSWVALRSDKSHSGAKFPQ